MNLLNGRGYMEGGYESNQPNTIDGCADGSYGLYREDESIDKIVVRSGGIDGSGSGSDLEAGKPRLWLLFTSTIMDRKTSPIFIVPTMLMHRIGCSLEPFSQLKEVFRI